MTLSYKPKCIHYIYTNASCNVDILCMFADTESAFTQEAAMRLIALYKDNIERLTDKYYKKKAIWSDIADTLKAEGMCFVSFLRSPLFVIC